MKSSKAGAALAEPVAHQSNKAKVALSLALARIGFDGQYKVGCWTPVWVTLVGGAERVSGRVELIAPDADGVPARYAGQGGEVALPAGGEVTVIRYAIFGRVRGQLALELRNDSGILATKSYSLGDLPAANPSSTEIVVTVGRPIGVDEALQLRRSRGEEKTATALITRAGDLPDRWWGYEGADAVCWAGSQSDLVAQLAEEQLAALEMWVRMGGRLILSVGAEGETLLGAQGRFARFNPGRFVEVAQQRRTADLERYAGASQALVRPDLADAFPLALSVLADLPFREEAAEGSGAARRATIVRFPLGLGQVVLATIDLDRPPVADWPGRPRLVARLLGTSAEAREEQSGERQLGQVTHVGFEDLGGQLRGALDQFAEVPLFPFSWVAGLLVLYILLIGPADYFFLRRIAGRMEFTWITLPLVVLAFCAGAVLLANAWKGNQRRLNQVDLVDVDLEGGLVRGTSWTNLYTPKTEEFHLSFEAVLPLKGAPPAALFTWHGLAGKGLGGMDDPTTISLFHRPYTIVGGIAQGGAPAELVGLPVQVSGTKSLAARWWSQAEIPSSGRLAADADGRLQGEFINPLDVDLVDGVLLFESSAYKLKSRIAPAERLLLTSQSSVLHLERRLTQRRIVEAGETKVPWNPESFDVPRILEIMMFHDAAGGRAYTGLTHRQQAYIDLSSHLKTGRAVLMARAESPVGRLIQDGAPISADQHYTFFRLVFPVSGRGREGSR